MANFVSYDHLSPSNLSLIASLSAIAIPKTIKEALSHPSWHDVMLEEIKLWMIIIHGN